MYYLATFLLSSAQVRGVDTTACVCVCVHAEGELENKGVANFAHKIIYSINLILMDSMSRS